MEMKSRINSDSLINKLVEVSIRFLSIGEIDTMNEKFQAQVKITANWLENEIIDKYNPDVHWNPKLFIENAFQEPKEKIKYNLIREGKYFKILIAFYY